MQQLLAGAEYNDLRGCIPEGQLKEEGMCENMDQTLDFGFSSNSFSKYQKCLMIHLFIYL